eukprot:TRINITY_DN14189_c2_g2_i4.p1 TRINITY_DN14189_c2_g2~~TRINITY_DN14189_c2_g2_i4.p1  ORF type:complete len:1371 (-),score=263.30 TRINITY_DN14189_c2_g2_i4:102-4214(-)
MSTRGFGGSTPRSSSLAGASTGAAPKKLTRKAIRIHEERGAQPAVTATQSLRLPRGTASASKDGRGSLPGTIIASRKTSFNDAASVESSTKGMNILVVVRVRPILPGQDGNGPDGVKVRDGGQIMITDGQHEKLYAADEIFDSRNDWCGQEYVFDQVGMPLVDEALNGFNICSFAYGHTGSGKTYTMLGSGDSVKEKNIDIFGGGSGFLPRFTKRIFEAHASDPSTAGRVRYTAEFYEVYNEQIRDLLVADNSNRNRVVRVHPKHGVLVEGISKAVVSSQSETLDLVNFGNQMRIVATTTMNRRSSRSHAIFTFNYEQVAEDDGQAEEDAGTRRHSTIMFVDLAGREDQNASMHKAMLFREMTYINTSLFHLAHLITKLSEAKGPPNSLKEFRNSKLTLLLAQALGGNSRTALIATLAPSQGYFHDSVSTLNFAQNVKKIQTKPVVNNTSTRNVVSELEAEVRRLNAMLSTKLDEKKTDHNQMQQDLAAAQALISHYKQSWKDAMLRSNIQREARRRASVAMGLMPLENVELATALERRGGDDQLPGPFLTKLTDDQALQGCCNYFLTRSSPLRIGSNPTADIIIQGLGINRNMCQLRRAMDTKVYIELLHDDDSDSDSDSDSSDDDGDGKSSSTELSNSGSDEPVTQRVLVNGKQIPDDEHIVLTHGDSIVFGYGHAFRLVVPTPEMALKCGRSDPTSLARASIENLEGSSAIAAFSDDEDDAPGLHVEGCAFKEVQHGLNVYSRLIGGLSTALKRAIRIVCPLVDEANTVTKAVLGNSSLWFRVQVLPSFNEVVAQEAPELLICVLERRSAPVTPAVAGGDEGGGRPVPKRMPVRRSSLLPSNTLAAVCAAGMSDLAGARTSREESVLYIWTLEKFLERLSIMNQVYEEGRETDFQQVRQRLREKPSLNPWVEMTFANVKQEIEMGAGAVDDGERPSATSSLAPLTPIRATAPVGRWLSEAASSAAGASPREATAASPRRPDASDAAAGPSASGPAAAASSAADFDGCQRSSQQSDAAAAERTPRQLLGDALPRRRSIEVPCGGAATPRSTVGGHHSSEAESQSAAGASGGGDPAAAADASSASAASARSPLSPRLAGRQSPVRVRSFAVKGGDPVPEEAQLPASARSSSSFVHGLGRTSPERGRSVTFRELSPLPAWARTPPTITRRDVETRAAPLQSWQFHASGVRTPPYTSRSVSPQRAPAVFLSGGSRGGTPTVPPPGAVLLASPVNAASHRHIAVDPALAMSILSPRFQRVRSPSVESGVRVVHAPRVATSQMLSGAEALIQSGAARARLQTAPAGEPAVEQFSARGRLQTAPAPVLTPGVPAPIATATATVVEDRQRSASPVHSRSSITPSVSALSTAPAPG